MAHLIANSFSSYELEENEVLQGSILTELQKQVLQNQLSAVAEERLRLDYDVKEPLSFVQQEAYKKGQIELLTFILESSESAEYVLHNPDHNSEEV